jgi:hypothetical protein
MNFNPQQIEHEIANLILLYPELEDDEQLRADMVEGQTSTFEFLSMLVRRIGETEATAAGTAEYMKELAERRARLGRRIEAFRTLAFKLMQAANIKKAELPEATLSIRNGTPKVIISDETAIPDGYYRLKREPDKTSIKAALASGLDVPGAVMSNAEPTISIRIK